MSEIKCKLIGKDSLNFKTKRQNISPIFLYSPLKISRGNNLSTISTDGK